MKELLYYKYDDKWAENTKRLGLNDYEYALLLLEKEKSPSPLRITRMQEAERIRNFRYNNGICQQNNKDCSRYFGINIAENYVSNTFEDPIRMPNDNPGFDWVCKKGYKIQHKARCLTYREKRIYWAFDIKYNNIADYFMFSGWDSRSNLEPMYVLMFHKNDIVRGDVFWRRENINITNRQNYLIEFRKYELSDKLEKLKVYCNGK